MYKYIYIYTCVYIYTHDICIHVYMTESVGPERSRTSGTKVAGVLSCNDKGNKLALKTSAAIR